jgi:lipid-binding SYLF domain-containing protein
MRSLIRPLLIGLAPICLVLGLAGCASGPSPTAEQDLVDKATLSVQGMMTAREGHDAQPLLRRAIGVVVCPELFRASFVVGGAGGDCVLASRGSNGWSNPAFYQLSTGSLGLQVGVQDTELMLLILSQRALQAVIDDQFKIGGSANLAFATLGTGVEGATTAAMRADIVAFARNRGLYAGLSLDGSLLSSLSSWDSGYYGRVLGPQDILLGGQGSNPGAAPLREILARFSGGP